MPKKDADRKAKMETIRKAVKRVVGDDDPGLFPIFLERVAEVASIELKLEDPDTYRTLLESQCGADDDSQPVEQYDGTLGVATAFVNAHQAPVGQLQWNDNLATIYTNPGSVSGVRWCTGTMISADLFLAAGHCFDQTGGGWTRPKDNTTGATISPAEIASNMHVNFNYQVDPSGNLQVAQSFAVNSLVEYRLGNLDFAIVRLNGNPGLTYGITGVSTTDAAVGDMMCIIGHPAGTPKRVEAGPATSFSGDWIRYDDIDTLGGNSGSGILRASDGRIVGVHTNGGCNIAGTGENRGVRITSIIAQSPTLQVITAPTLTRPDDRWRVKIDKFIDDRSKWRIDRDWGTLKALDDVKQPGLDKQFSDHKRPGRDRGLDPYRSRIPSRRSALRLRSPFILSTPHHSRAWAGGAPQTPESHLEREQLQAQYEEALDELESTQEMCLEQLREMDDEYRQLLAEYFEI